MFTKYLVKLGIPTNCKSRTVISVANRHMLTVTVRPSVRCVPNTHNRMTSQPSRAPNCNCNCKLKPSRVQHSISVSAMSRSIEAQLDCGPGSEIGVGWKIGVTWSRKRSLKMAATELGYLLTNYHFVLVYDMMYQSLGRWIRYSTKKCLPYSHLPFFYVVILSISPIWRIGGDKSLDQNF